MWAKDQRHSSFQLLQSPRLQANANTICWEYEIHSAEADMKEGYYWIQYVYKNCFDNNNWIFIKPEGAFKEVNKHRGKGKLHAAQTFKN